MNESIEPLDFTHLPPGLVGALGWVTARSGQIEHLLVVTLRRTTDGEWNEVFEHAKGKCGEDRRKEAKEAFREWASREFTGNEVPYRVEQFDDGIDRIGEIATRRNVAIHCAWGIDPKTGLLSATNRGRLLVNAQREPFGIADVERVASDLRECLYLINAATKPGLVSPQPELVGVFSRVIPSDAVVYVSAAPHPIRSGRVTLEVGDDADELTD